MCSSHNDNNSAAFSTSAFAAENNSVSVSSSVNIINESKEEILDKYRDTMIKAQDLIIKIDEITKQASQYSQFSKERYELNQQKMALSDELHKVTQEIEELRQKLLESNDSRSELIEELRDVRAQLSGLYAQYEEASRKAAEYGTFTEEHREWAQKKMALADQINELKKVEKEILQKLGFDE